MGNFLRAASDDCESLPFERDLTELGLDRNDPAAPAIAYISRLHGYKGAEQAAQIAARFNYLNEHEPETTYILSREMYRVPGEHTLHISGAASLVGHAYKAAESPQQGFDTACRTLARIFIGAQIELENEKHGGLVVIDAANINAVVSVYPSALSHENIGIRRRNDGDMTAYIQRAERITGIPKGDISGIPGKRVAIVGMGGGSDIVQATQMARLLQQDGRECAGLVSVRGSIKSMVNYERQLTGGVYQTNHATSTPDGRYFEDLPAGLGYNTFAVLNNPVNPQHDLDAQLHTVLSELNADTIIGVDTGGDVLYRKERSELNGAVASPDQDQRVLAALCGVGAAHNKRVMAAIFGCGIDTPSYASEVVQQAKGWFVELSEEERAMMLAGYTQMGLPSRENHRFAKTLPAVVAAQQAKTGLFVSPIPLEHIYGKELWNPYSILRPETGDIIVADAYKLAAAIGL